MTPTDPDNKPSAMTTDPDRAMTRRKLLGLTLIALPLLIGVAVAWFTLGPHFWPFAKGFALQLLALGAVISIGLGVAILTGAVEVSPAKPRRRHPPLQRR